MKHWERQALLAVTLNKAQPRKKAQTKRIHYVGKVKFGPPPNICQKVRYRYAPRTLRAGDECPACEMPQGIIESPDGLHCRQCLWECRREENGGF